MRIVIIIVSIFYVATFNWNISCTLKFNCFKEKFNVYIECNVLLNFIKYVAIKLFSYLRNHSWTQIAYDEDIT